MQISPDRKRRQDALRQRLQSFRRDWTVADLGRLAFSIAEKRESKNWKNDRSAVQSLVRFLNGQHLSVWTELATENLVLYLEQERDQKRRAQNAKRPRVAGVEVEPGTVAGIEIENPYFHSADVLLVAEDEVEFPDGPDLENSNSEKLSDLFMKVAVRLEELGL